MPQQFPIHQVLSSSAGGRKQMVSVRYGKLTVTRHIIDGVGRHPDDTLPRHYDRMQKDLLGLIADQQRTQKALTEVKAIIEAGKALKGALEAAKLIAPALEVKLGQLTANIAMAKDAFEEAQAENPLMVQYIQQQKEA